MTRGYRPGGGGGWHRPSKRLIVSDNIMLLPPPHYSPELNPMKSVRDYPRGNKLSSLVWDSYETIFQACEPAGLFLVNNPPRIVSIGTRAWARVNS